MATRLPREQVARLDRLAERRRVTRSALINGAIMELLEGGEEPLSPLEKGALARRRRDAEAMRRLGQINRRLKSRPDVSPSGAGSI